MSLKARPKAAVFDLDGTLIDSEALVREGYFAATDRMSLPFTDADFHSFVGLNRDANDARLIELFGADFPIEDFYLLVRETVGDRAAPLKPGALDTLDALDALNAPVALATSSARPWVDRQFAAHDLAPRFAAIFARGDYEFSKPHPEPYLKAAAALGHAHGDTIALEDSPAGTNAALAAGLVTIVVPDLLPPIDDPRVLTAQSLHDVAAWLRAIA